MTKSKGKRRNKERFGEKLFRQRILLVTLLALVVGGGLIAGSYWYSRSQIDSVSSPCGEDSPSPVTTTEITEEPTKGCLDAPVTIVEFSEFYCPYCARFAFDTMPEIEEEYVKRGLVKIVFRNFPVHGEPALLAALAGECAHEQGRFWDYHDKLYSTIFEVNKYLDETALRELADELGLDAAAFSECLSSERYRENIEEDLAEGQRRGVRGTPTFFINGRMVVGAQPFETFKQIIEEELKRSGK